MWVAAALGVVVGVVALQAAPDPLPVLAAAPNPNPPAHLQPDLPSQPSPDADSPEDLRQAVLTQPVGVEEALEREDPDFDGLIAALAHDNIPGNARSAYHRIKSLVIAPDRQLRGAEESAAMKSTYKTFKQKLSLALLSPDRQQRQLAACLLSFCGRGGYPKEVAIVLVEGLRYDLIEGWNCGVNNAATSVRFFARHPEEIEAVLPHLSRALASDDGQERFLAAYVLGRASRKETAPTVCPILIDRLRDNGIGGDEALSRHALYGMGDSALPYINSALAYSYDGQSVRVLHELQVDLRRPDGEVRRHYRGDPLKHSIVEWGDRMSRDRFYTPR